MHMSYRNAGCENYTSNEIEQWIFRVEDQLQKLAQYAPDNVQIQPIQQQLDDLRADLILKKQEARAEMKQLLMRLLLLVDST